MEVVIVELGEEKVLLSRLLDARDKLMLKYDRSESDMLEIDLITIQIAHSESRVMRLQASLRGESDLSSLIVASASTH